MSHEGIKCKRDKFGGIDSGIEVFHVFVIAFESNAHLVTHRVQGDALATAAALGIADVGSY